jgi:hypothetical protein
MIDWEGIKARHTIEGVLEKRGIKLRKTSTGYTCKCPIHAEANGEGFSIDVKKQLWNCFGKCQAGGDVIKLVMDLESLCATGAAEWLEGRPLRDEHRIATAPKPVAPPKQEVLIPRELPHIPKLYGGEIRHWDKLAQLRKLPHSDGVEMAVKMGVVRFCLAYEHPAWAVLDLNNPCNVQVRRLDGELWFDRLKVIGIKGNWAAWPVGLSVALKYPKAEILLVEGMGDFIAGYHAHTSCMTEGIPVAMFGAGQNIHDGALAVLCGRKVRIIEQHDEAGDKATQRWSAQLTAGGAQVITRQIPTPGEDLNDHISANREPGGLFTND